MKPDKNAGKKDLIVEYLSRFPFYKWAAAYAGIDKTTLENWRHDDKPFSSRCEVARAEAIARLGKRATPDFMLKSADPESFKDRVDVTSGDKPIPILGGVSITKDDISKHNSTTEDSQS